ncbi:MAG: hypothetical protein PHW69_02625 [Elusimicrobiaceae bacterium]|nr:hypothetical protein [Elusimicrobiaceae bacterium]
MKFTFSFSGGTEKLEELRRALADGLENAVTLAGEEMSDEVRKSLAVSARSADGRPLASAPGEPPHRRTGRLQDSVACEISADGENGFVAAVGDLYGDAPYAKALEYGTETVRPRPFLLPALLTGARKLAQRVKELAQGGNT